MDTCDDVAATVIGGAPAGYTLDSGESLNATVGQTAPCTVTQTDGGATLTFVAITPP